jgi:hypothetical protein
MAWANFLLLGNFLMAWRMWRIFGEEFRPLVRDMALVYVVPIALFGAAAFAFPAAGIGRLAASVLAGLLGLVGAGTWFRPRLTRFLAERRTSPA